MDISRRGKRPRKPATGATAGQLSPDSSHTDPGRHEGISDDPYPAVAVESEMPRIIGHNAPHLCACGNDFARIYSEEVRISPMRIKTPRERGWFVRGATLEQNRCFESVALQPTRIRFNAKAPLSVARITSANERKMSAEKNPVGVGETYGARREETLCNRLTLKVINRFRS